ncbi:MAG: cofactor-independent phosphoglycerate mutase [Clostridia bacterium]|nr:cofactor-independent phosphoglycerate mutase [Clostridia bacterium]
MKYVVILGDGMADYKLKELGDKTPLQYARKPNLDRLAQSGILGMVRTVPEGLSPGSDVANLSVMGYNPELYYTGRSPLEAVSMGVNLGDEDVAFRCNLVTLSDEPDYEQKTMLDYSSDEISSAEAALLMHEVNQRLGTEIFKFYPGVSYRHLLVWHQGPTDFKLTPPHDISDRKITDYLPRGESGEVLLNLMKASSRFLAGHPVNKDRVARGLRPANSLWIWGQGKKPALPGFLEKYGLTGSVISAVDLTKGLGLCAGLEVVEVPGATGNINTNFRGKALAALEELKKGKDFVYIHIEAPDEAGHRGELDNKVKAIEEIDAKVVAEVLNGLEEFDDYRVMILPDHPTPLSLRTHVPDEVPFLIYQKSCPQQSSVSGYDEDSARSTGLLVERGYELMDRFIGVPSPLQQKN